MNEEKINLLLEGINELLCLCGEQYRDNPFVVGRLNNLTSRIEKLLNPTEEPQLTEKTKDALGRKEE